MSQTDQSIQQPHLNESTNTFSSAQSHKQSTSDNPLISVESSQEFRNIDASRSQDITASFNTLTESNNQETSNQKQTQNSRPEQKLQQSATQQVLPEVQEQSKPQQPPKQQPKQQLQPQQKQPSQPAVDYQSMVSLKIFEKKINQSLQLKNQGNQFYKANQYQQAIQKYSQGLAILDPQQFYGATHAQCQKMAQVSASLLYNIGMCFFNINSWKQAEVYFNQTILINPNHIKALHRRALSRYHLKNYQQAMNDIKQAFNKDRSNAQVHESYEKILKMYNQQLKKEKETMKEISSKIFRKESQNSSTVSPSKQQKKDEEQDKQEEVVKQQGQQESSGLWGLAPLALVAVAGLFYGYKKFFGK